MENAFSDFKKFLIPLSYIITPNVIEAEKIASIKIKSLKDMKNSSKKNSENGGKKCHNKRRTFSYRLQGYQMHF